MKKVLLFSALLFLVFTSKAQYDPLYNQYLFNQALINPAYVGAFDNVSVTLMSRAQWVGIEGAPITNSLTAHTSIFNNKGGAGIYVLNDRLGVSNNTEVFATFSYKVDFGKARLAAGLQGGMIQYKYDYSELNMEFVNDPSFMPTDENFLQPNFGFGALYYSEYYYIGVSVPRILDVTVNDGISESTRYKRHYYLSGGIIFPLSNGLKIKPSTLVRVVDNQVSVDINGSVLLAESLWLGLLIRNFNTFGALAQLQISDRLRLGYSMELPSTKLITNQWGTHEIMVGFDFAPFNRQVLKRRYF
ncbi:MAG: type IX secretion system membrane protein PorP/SprF [Cyclobacteriaceae bacterium]|nr:type IX secretion system membrane protein PorP/SprF [Cyclobacteriaceae bacterium]